MTEKELLLEISNTLNSILHIIRVTSTPQIREILENELDSVKKREVYSLLDGKKTVREIEKISGVNISKISNWSSKWGNLGLIVESGKTKVKGRREKAFDLINYGIKMR